MHLKYLWRLNNISLIFRITYRPISNTKNSHIIEECAQERWLSSLLWVLSHTINLARHSSCDHNSRTDGGKTGGSPELAFQLFPHQMSLRFSKRLCVTITTWRATERDPCNYLLTCASTQSCLCTTEIPTRESLYTSRHYYSLTMTMEIIWEFPLIPCDFEASISLLISYISYIRTGTLIYLYLTNYLKHMKIIQTACITSILESMP